MSAGQRVAAQGRTSSWLSGCRQVCSINTLTPCFSSCPSTPSQSVGSFVFITLFPLSLIVPPVLRIFLPLYLPFSSSSTARHPFLPHFITVSPSEGSRGAQAGRGQSLHRENPPDRENPDRPAPPEPKHLAQCKFIRGDIIDCAPLHQRSFKVNSLE